MPIPPSEIYARNFLMHRGALQDLYAELPEEQAHFSAWDGHDLGQACRITSRAAARCSWG
ncbi:MULTISPECIES: hypothetical protein [Deinococcus]|uniref:hypothetical protein n=1 Tax=Deinococcus TaxID=1298 RepID=UPI000051C52E|nr:MULTISPECIES: hypothetical protein [Deinococcus]MBI0446781.1 hypothetical protein [Deinococcus sp. DB0503]